jgi:exodeoxyribonuclease VII small subunit
MNKELGFEAAVEKLDAILKKLESGAATLDESLTLFEEGVSLIKYCNKKLEGAEQKVKILTENFDGTVTDTDFLYDEN